jgi:hypothetical protein
MDEQLKIYRTAAQNVKDNAELYDEEYLEGSFAIAEVEESK